MYYNVKFVNVVVFIKSKRTNKADLLLDPPLPVSLSKKGGASTLL